MVADVGEVCELSLFVGVESSVEPVLEPEGVRGRCIDFRYGIEPGSLMTIGEGSGVRSGILARNGEAKAEAEPGDAADPMLEVERFDRMLEPRPSMED